MHPETRRKFVHIAQGTILFVAAVLLADPRPVLGILFATALGVSMLMQRYYIPQLERLRTHVQREGQSDVVPIQGTVFMTMGVFCAAVLFPKVAALSGVIAVTVGDSVAALVGIRMGTWTYPLNPRKNIEGLTAGFMAVAVCLSVLIGPVNAIITATVVMFTESIVITAGDHRLDDNLFIPLVAAITVTTLML